MNSSYNDFTYRLYTLPILEKRFNRYVQEDLFPKTFTVDVPLYFQIWNRREPKEIARWLTNFTYELFRPLSLQSFDNPSRGLIRNISRTTSSICDEIRDILSCVSLGEMFISIAEVRTESNLVGRVLIVVVSIPPSKFSPYALFCSCLSKRPNLKGSKGLYEKFAFLIKTPDSGDDFAEVLRGPAIPILSHMTRERDAVPMMFAQFAMYNINRIDLYANSALGQPNAPLSGVISFFSKLSLWSCALGRARRR